MNAKTPAKVDSASMAERFSKVGARIDLLIEKSQDAQERVKQQVVQLKRKEEDTVHKSVEALDDLKGALDAAWSELNEAWEEIRNGLVKAGARFQDEAQDKTQEVLNPSEPQTYE